MADGSIVFKTAIDTSGLSSGGKKVARETKAIIREAEQASAAATSAVKKQEREVEALAAKLKQLQGRDTRTKKYAAATDRAEGLKSKIFGMERQRAGITGNTFGDVKQREALTASIRDARKELNELLADIEKMETSGKAFVDTGDDVSELSEKVQAAKARLAELEKQEGETAAASKERIAQALAMYREVEAADRKKASDQRAAKEREGLIGGIFGQTGMQVAGALSGDVVSIIGLVKSGVGVIGNGLQRIGKGLQNIAKRAADIVKKIFQGNQYLNRMARRIVSITASALLFNRLSRAMTEMTNALSSVIEKNASYNSALSALKGNLAAAFAPIWNIAVPALTSLINLLARAAGMLAQFSAVLSGGTVEGAEAAAKALWAQANAAEGAGGAAADAKRQLAGFDDLVRLEDATGGGGGGSSSGIAPNIGNDLVAALEGREFASLGKRLGKRLSDAFSAAAEAIKWENVSGKVEGGLKQVADFVNGFFSADAFAPMGTAVGSGIQTALMGAATFAQQVDWSALAKSVTNGINNAVEAINWITVKTKLKDACKNIASGINAGIKNLDWKNVGKAIGGGLRTAVDSVTTTLNEIDWGALGAGVSDMIVEALGGIDHNVIGNAIKSMIDAGVSFFGNMDLGGIIREVAEIMVDIFNAAGGDIAYGIIEILADIASIVLALFPGGQFAAIGAQLGKMLLQGLLNGVLGSDGTFWTRFKQPFLNMIDTVKAIFGIKSPSTVFKGIGQNLMQGLINGITGTKVSLRGALNSVVSTMESWANLCIRAINSAIVALNKVKIRIPAIAGITSGFSLNPNISTVSAVTIPRLATGAVIPPNREFMAVLGDQHSGNNIEAPEGLIRRIVREESGNTDVLLEILDAIRAGQVLTVNGRVLGETVRSQLSRDARAAGTDLALT